MHLAVDPPETAESSRDDVWSIEKPDDLEECQGSSPRKRPLGVSMFDREPLANESADLEYAVDPRLSVRWVLATP